ncbi:PAS domain-containing hybrid sensor histidine kinase/response regulator [Cupriavidus sp. P-10]|uniref:PAS domain-containing hybrid sensor histidine kinase/response regulator n=1 Tax=Cupriavidus sp. P-10 TaxID=2027911 RepID=UPI000E2E8FB2|nr:PAS domain-containing hybrid sensor histidine kinase/response regulator [Cupriavidus sp. P-10]BDB27592.1 PAS domain-containing hybrid sensor histidine kinase/response regulator [Cupriavidus sp. P-10]
MDQDRSRRHRAGRAGGTPRRVAGAATFALLLACLLAPAAAQLAAQPPAPHGALAPWAWPLALLSAAALLALAVNYLRLRRQVRLTIHAETLLQRQLAFKNALLGALPYPVAARDAAQRYIEVNPAFEALCGFGRDDIIGRPAGAAISGQSAEVTAATDSLCREALATMAPACLQLDIRSNGGNIRRVLYWASPFRDGDGDGSTGGVITTLVDITEICEAQQRARLLERRLQDVTSSLPAIVYQIRKPHDGSPPAYTYAAGGTDSSLGITPMALMTPPGAVGRHLHPDDIALVHDALSRPPPCTPVDLDVRVLGRHGLRWARIRSVGRYEGDATVWSGVVADVTDQHRQAAALARAKDAAEASLRAKESFLAMMSHEIRTPLNGVLGMVEVLRRTKLDTEQHRMLALAQESGYALAQILDDVLDYARIEAGRLAILPAPMDLRALSDSVLGLLAPQAHNKQLHLRVHIAAEVPASIEADTIRLRQILFNLLGNAIKFTDHGSVTLRLEAAPVQDGAVLVILSVSDTGIGISPEDQGRLFAPFVQSEQSSARQHGGTGLGLSICKRLADLMGGKLSIHSEPGEGTLVSLRLRCPVVARDYDLPALRGRTVLLDLADAALAGTLRQHARAAGMRVFDPAGQSESGSESGAGSDCIRLTDAGPPAGEAPAAAPADRVVHITSTPKQLGFRVCESGVRLSQNPLRWSAFLGAMEAALGMPDAGAGAGAGQEPAAGADGPDISTHPADPVVVTTPDGEPVHVLVVEDHPINRELIRQQLDVLGYARTVCRDGAEALARLQQSRFHLVLTDCHMPGMDGFELAHAIRASADARVRGLPIVGVTATTLAEEHARCFAVGMNQCVLKPTTLASLQAAMSRALEFPEAIADAIIPSGRQGPPTEAAPLRFEPARLCAGQLGGALGPPPWSGPMLATCIGALRADRDELKALLPGAAVGELRRWCHRASGAMSVFGHAYVDQLVDRFGAALKASDPARIRAVGAVVLAMMEHLLGVLGQQQQPDTTGVD